MTPRDTPIGVYDDEADDYDGAAVYDELEDQAAATPEPRPRRPRPNMARAPRPRDHRRPRPAVQREAEGPDTVDIDFRGHTYTVPADQDDWSIDALEALEANRTIAGVRELLGPEQWAQFKTRNNTRRAFREFVDVVGEVFGFETAGN